MKSIPAKARVLFCPLNDVGVKSLERVTGIRDNVARSSVSSALTPLLRGLNAQQTYARRHKTVHRTVLFSPALSGSLPLMMSVLNVWSG